MHRHNFFRFLFSLLLILFRFSMFAALPIQERADRFLALANAGYQAVYRVNSETQWTAVTDVTPEHDLDVIGPRSQVEERSDALATELGAFAGWKQDRDHGRPHEASTPPGSKTFILPPDHCQRRDRYSPRADLPDEDSSSA